MLKLKLQYCGHLMQRANSLEKTLKQGLRAGGEGDDRGWDGWMASPTQWTWVWANSKRWWGTERPGVSMGSQSRAWLSDWTTTSMITKVAWSSQHDSFCFHTQRLPRWNPKLAPELRGQGETEGRHSLCRLGGGRFNKQVTSLQGWS